MPKIISLVDHTPTLQEDSWQLMEEAQAQDTKADEAQPIIWPLSHWEAAHARGQALPAVWLRVEEPVDALAKSKIWPKIIGLRFGALTDGRGFSQARILRERYHYTGEIRALGTFMPDQMYYMARCGFSSFALNARMPDDLDTYFKTFSLAYQSANDDMQIIPKRRV